MGDGRAVVLGRDGERRPSPASGSSLIQPPWAASEIEEGLNRLFNSFCQADSARMRAVSSSSGTGCRDNDPSSIAKPFIARGISRRLAALLGRRPAVPWSSFSSNAQARDGSRSPPLSTAPAVHRPTSTLSHASLRLSTRRTQGPPRSLPLRDASEAKGRSSSPLSEMAGSKEADSPLVAS